MTPTQSPSPVLERLASFYDIGGLVRKDPKATILWLEKQISLLENSLEFARGDVEIQRIEDSIEKYRKMLINLQLTEQSNASN